MGGLKKHFPDIRFSGNLVTPDEMDQYIKYDVINPGTSLTWVGTCAAGTNAQAKALVLINKSLDYPRNLMYGVVGTNDVGGSWTVNGYDQFGVTVTETVGNGTVAKGTPAFSNVGTQIFAEVTSGTFTFATGSAGNGSAQLGVPLGGTDGSIAYFGLPTKISAITDVKSITYMTEFAPKTLDGGTISTTLVDATNHRFCGTADLDGTTSYSVTINPKYNAEYENTPMANW